MYLSCSSEVILKVENLNSISNSCSVKKQYPNFAAIRIAPELEHFCTEQEKSALEIATEGYDCFVTRTMESPLTLNCSAIKSSSQKGLLGFFKAIFGALSDITANHKLIEGGEDIKLLPNRKGYNIYTMDEVFLGHTSNFNPIEILVNRCIENLT